MVQETTCSVVTGAEQFNSASRYVDNPCATNDSGAVGSSGGSGSTGTVTFSFPDNASACCGYTSVDLAALIVHFDGGSGSTGRFTTTTFSGNASGTGSADLPGSAGAASGTDPDA